VGSFAQRLNQQKTFCERPGHSLQRDVAANSTLCRSTAAERDIPRGISHQSEPCLYQQDSAFTHVTPFTATSVSKIGVLAKFNESRSLESEESAVDEEILLPPPPEFDDSFNVPAPSCFTEATYHCDAVKEYGIDGWSVDEVCTWLDTVDLGEHCAAFRVKSIDGARVRTLGRSELIDLGVTDVHDRMKFERALRKVLKN